jgi:hypothetical protein
VQKNTIPQIIKVIMLAAVMVGVPALAQAPSEDAPSDLGAEVQELKERLRRLEQLLSQQLEKSEGATETAQAVATEETGRESEARLVTGEEGNSTGRESGVAAASVPAQVATLTNVPSAPTATEPQNEQPVGVARTGGQNLTVTGLVDAYYSNNFNNPPDGTNAL